MMWWDFMGHIFKAGTLHNISNSYSSHGRHEERTRHALLDTTVTRIFETTNDNVPPLPSVKTTESGPDYLSLLRVQVVSAFQLGNSVAQLQHSGRSLERARAETATEI